MAALVKIALLTGALAGTTASGVAGQQDALDSYRTQMANMRANGQPVTDQTFSNPALASALAQWRSLQQTDGLPFDSYAGFLLQHPGWPDQARNRRLAERQAGSAPSPSGVVTFFAKYPPQTATGGMAYARALLATGQRDQAYAQARAAWRRGSMSSADEASALGSFAGALTTDDHDARMDMLLWQGATGAAARELPYTSAAMRPVFEARLAFRTRAANAADLAVSTQALGSTDAGYIADRATWLRNTGNAPAVRSYLASRPALTRRPGDVEEWYEVLLSVARDAANDGQWQTAYDIARRVDDAYPTGFDVSTEPYGERDDYTSLVWLAGQAAMKHLGRAADAATLFDRYARASQTPWTRAKGFYWAGRALQQAGQSQQAMAYFNQAAGYRDQFYGQLATERMGRALTAPPAYEPNSVTPAERQAFYASEPVRAAQFLGQIGDHQDQTAFLRQIANDAQNDSDHVLAKELAVALKRPDLGVMVGRSALRNGFSDYSAAGYPSVDLPAGLDDQWTMIHAISRQESQFDRAAVSHAGARGLMQLMPGTAREAAGKIGLAYSPDTLTTDVDYNVQLGSSYFQRIYNMYGSYPLAIAAYNAGPGNVNKWLRANGDPRTGGTDVVDWIEAIPYSETRNYVQRVLENAVVYDLLYPQHARSRGPNNMSWYLGKGQPG